MAILAVSLISVAVRYPVSHELGVDSFEIQSFANMIIQTREMGWLATPYSYLGMAPMSYPSAVPIGLASFAMVAGIDTEPAILVYSMLLAIVVTLGAFLFGKAAFRRDSVGWIAALLIATSGGMVAFTDWTLSARGTFLAFLPLALALAVRTLMNPSQSHGRVGTAILFVVLIMALTHLMWLLVTPLLLAAWLVARIAKTENAVLVHRIGLNARDAVISASLALLLAGAVVLLLIRLPGAYGVGNFPELRAGILPDNLLTRMAVYFATIMGIGIIIAPLGVIAALRIGERLQRYAVISVVLPFVPVALDPTYGALVAIPAVLLLVAAGLRAVPDLRIIRQRGHGVRVGTVVVASAIIISAPYLITVPRVSAVACGQGGSIDPPAYNTALYLEHLTSDTPFTFVSDDTLNTARIQAISGRPAVEAIASVGVIGYPWLAERFHPQFMQVSDPFNSLFLQQQVLVVKEWIPGAAYQPTYYSGKHTFLLLNSAPSSALAQQIEGFYSTRIAVDICGGSSSPFFVGLRSQNYVTYRNDMETVYWIQGSR